ncbi:mechanosensitive ion channel family protein [Natronococcus occultus]|uniref:Small-conductance mechanosensitive channel n=1 Tax=Natronococcus occultus SP4 TaxID=694430 RepID=L0K3B4_9EURY|nr:mechanosensitive ion channel family protein [Natronococcus occultus]AGB38824.1 small-conductance mechanosensitive channel [Natronococcus occultus SP4]
MSDSGQAIAEETVSSLPVVTTEEQLLALTVAVLLGTVLLLAVFPRGIQRLQTTLEDATERDWGETLERYLPVGRLAHAIVRLGQLGVVVGGIVGVLHLWGYESPVWYTIEILTAMWPSLSRMVASGVVLLAAYLGGLAVASWMDSLSANAPGIDRHDREIITRVLQLTLLITAVLFVLTLWNFDISGLLVGAGVIGVVLGFAAQETLGSVIAGFILMFSRPFEIGDWIVVGDDRGIVTDITIVHTRIRGPNGEHVIIPNEVIGSRTIRNRSNESRLRFAVDVGVDYETDLETAREVAQEAVESLEIVEETPFPSVRIEELADSSVVLRIRFWIAKPNTEKMWKAEDEVLGAAKTALEDAGVNIPYPHLRSVTEAKPTREPRSISQSNQD